MKEKNKDQKVKFNKIINNFIWRLMERFGAQGISFIVSVVLARILGPKTFGMIALVTVFISISQVFVDSGMGNALIQKKNTDDLDFSSVFYMNIVLCSVLYGLIFATAPIVAGFYSMPELTAVIRVLSITILVSGMKNVQQAYVSRNLLFKKFFWATLGGTIGAAIIGIWLALRGYGVWALVAQNLFNLTMDTIILWLTVEWRPKKMFSFERLKGLFGYGWKMLASSLIVTVYNNLAQLIIGKKYSSDVLAYFNKGKQLPYLISDNINTSIDSVLLPVMSKNQDDLVHIKSMTRRSVMLSAFLIWPMMIGFAVCSHNLITIILTEKWIDCVPFLMIFSIICAIRPISTANLNAIKAIGRSDLYLALEILKKVIGFAILLVSMWFGPMAMAFGLLLSEVINIFVNAFPNQKLLNYSIGEQLKDVIPSILLSCIMGGTVYILSYLSWNRYLLLFLQIVTGISIYMLGSCLFRFEQLNYILSQFKKTKNRKGSHRMKTIAVVPMKLNNRRLPQKNTKSFTNGKPLCTYILSTLLSVDSIDEVYVYCSNPDIVRFLPEGVRYLQRSSALDQDTTKMNEVLQCFAKDIPADIYVLTHATAPYITKDSIEKGLHAVQSGEWDSSFAAKRLQNFLWKDGKPFNYELSNIPRTQDIPALYEETSGFYIYTSDVITKFNRRIGDKPHIVEVGEIESIDIDNPEDFTIADAIYNYLLWKN